MKRFICTVLVMMTFQAFANTEHSLRRCTLLPVLDNLDGALAFRVFEGVEDELKKNSWCVYVSNSSLIDIFKKYDKNLSMYLSNEDVLKTVADKLNTGSNIKIDLKNEIKGIELHLKIIGGNGQNVLFEEKALFNEPEATLINNKILAWLKSFSEKIPYQGRVTGVLGDQITVELPYKFNTKKGQSFQVNRKIQTRIHPLLKKVVDWNTKSIGEGKVFSLNEEQVVGNIKTYYGADKVEKGDWVLIQEEPVGDYMAGYSQDEAKSYQFGKLGEIQASFDIGSVTMAASDNSGESNKLKGLVFGINIQSELWITREYFALGELGIHIGKLTKSSGSPSQSETTLTGTKFKVAGGYKYLPMGFFYGPQVNVYGGIASYRYGIDKSSSDGHGSISLSGLLLGAQGNVPVARNIRAKASFEFIPFGSSKDLDGIFGGETSVSSYKFNFGGKMRYNHWLNLTADYELNVNSAKYNGNPSSIVFRENIFRVGAMFTY